MASYGITQYLLDRANIHDTVTKVPLYYDTVNIPALHAEVYGPSIEIDYTSVLGGAPYTISRDEWIARIGVLLDAFESSQHVTSGIIAHLPQPGEGVTRPEKVLVQAQVSGNMIGKLQAGGSGEAPFMQNGGLLEAELQRDEEIEAKGQNPWRITKYKVIKKWDKGDPKVFDFSSKK
ncbi:hypothetical protein F5144DRAFT_38779 [Chaetomium tenue]|uniref:Uncharacterized protein n=1 Tax=Chaetomium tenue TaxID=1854479 RepID=A0ACB7PMF3_9PEZI|nr:hypothetical protein F5144DRAFT_38779 [Chaetomium globosum]